MTDGIRPARRGVLATIGRTSVLRILFMGLALMAGEGLIFAFHFEYGKGHIALPYSLAADYGGSALLCVGLIGAYALLVRWLERRWPGEARPSPGWTALGIVFGVSLFCAVYGVLTALGVAQFGGVNGFADVWPVFMIALVSGVAEELVFRGVLFRLLEESLGTTVALILSAAVFGLLHGANPGATVISTLAIAVEAGALLAAAYAWSRNLWLVIGLHFAWNFTEGGIFGAAVSGGAMKGVLNYPLSAQASALLTGGKFGPEASVVAVEVCFGLAVGFMILAARAGNWRRARFRLLVDYPCATNRSTSAP